MLCIVSSGTKTWFYVAKNLKFWFTFLVSHIFDFLPRFTDFSVKFHDFFAIFGYSGQARQILEMFLGNELCSIESTLYGEAGPFYRT